MLAQTGDVHIEIMKRIATFFQNLAHDIFLPAVLLTMISVIDFMNWVRGWTPRISLSEFFAHWSIWTLAFLLIYFMIDIWMAERKMQNLKDKT